MQIGIPKEIKNHENRVALTPTGASQLISAGHRVVVQTAAGIASGFSDQAYLDAGAIIEQDISRVWLSDLVVKVKEPLAAEYAYFRPDLTLFTFLHLAAVPELAFKLKESGVCAIAYETVQLKSGVLPLLAPMSQVAGRVAAQLAVHYLQRENGTLYRGGGKLPCAIGAAAAARAVIVGAGNVGVNAAEALAGLGVDVSLMEINEERIHRLQQQVHHRINVIHFDHDHFLEYLEGCDMLIGATLIPGRHAPTLMQREDLHHMAAGAVFIDVSIDQGGMCETSRVTTYDDPVYLEEGVIHCCLPNLPAVVPQTSTVALTDATLPYIQLIAGLGVEQAIESDVSVRSGLNIQHGLVVHEGVKAALQGK